MPTIVLRRRYPRVHHPYEGRIDPRRRRRLLAIADELPREPGVYRFYGYKDRLVYVGKAVCLRERVRSYFAETAVRRSHKLRRLLAEVNRLEVVPCGSELEALLLERRSIATLRPLLNREHQRFEIYPYILLTDEPYPRLALTRSEPLPAAEAIAPAPGIRLPLEPPPVPGEIPGLYLGPFANPRIAQTTYDIVRGLFPVRTCEGVLRPDPAGRDCYYQDIGRCSAPCVAAIDAQNYGALCAEIVELLQAGESPRLLQLRARMEELAAAWRFEEAAQVREQLRVLAMATFRLQRMQRMRSQNNVVVLQPSQNGPLWFNAFLIRSGAVWRHLHTDEWRLLREAMETVYAAPQVEADFTGRAQLDEMMLIDRWLRSHGTQNCCAWMPPANKHDVSSAIGQLQGWARSVQ